MWSSWLSSCRPRRFGVPWAAFCVAAVLAPAFAVSAHAQTPTPDIVLSKGTLHEHNGNWYLLEADWCFDCYTVKLATQPTVPVIVEVAEVDDNGNKITNPNLTISTEYTLVPSNPTPGKTHLWSTGFTVSLSASGDDGNSADEPVTLRHKVVGDPSNPNHPFDSNYPKGMTKTQIVTEVDNDRVAVLTPTRVTVPEGGTASYKVKLKSQPTGNVTVTVARKSGGDTNLTVDTDPNTTGNQNTLTFTTTTWSTDQTVTLQAAEDNDNLHGSAVFTHTASGADYTEPGATLTATTLTAVEHDNDNELKLSVPILSVREGKTKTYTVKLGVAPTDDVTVTVARESGNEHDTDLTVDTDPDTTGHQNTLTFTTENYSTAQTVTLRAAVDADDAHGSAVFTHTASGGGYDGVSETLTATEVDKRDVELSATPYSLYNVKVREGGTTTYKVWLGDKPSDDVTVTVARKSGGDTNLTVDTDPDTAGDQDTLTFTTTNYSTAQAVKLFADEDNDYYDGEATFAHTVSGAWTGTHEDDDITVSETDNDSDKTEPKLPPLSTKTATHPFLGSTSLPVMWIPEGETEPLSVKLATQPKSTVTVTVSMTTATQWPTTIDPDLKVAPDTLTFTSANWNVSQTVTLFADEECDPADPPPCTDDVLDGSAGVIFAANGDSGSYRGSVTLWVHESDNDNASRTLILSPTSVTVPEGSTASYTVKLASQPTDDVTVTVARKSGGDKNLTVDTDPDTAGDQDTLTFTTTNYSTAQTVTLSAAEESAKGGKDDNLNGTAVFTHTPDGAWIIAATELTATEADNDLVSVSEPVSVAFGTRTIQDQTYVLDAPIAPLTLPAATGGGGNVSYALSGTLPAGLTFDAETRVLTGTPTALQGAVSYTYTATAGNDTATLTFTIAVARDTRPVFVNEDPTIQLIANQVYTLNAAIPALTLPEATGGNPPITYALALATAAGTQGRTQAATGTDAGGDSGTLPAGLTFDPATRTLSGTPTALQSPRLYVYTATDYNGDQAKLEFTIAVETDREATFGDRTIGPQTYVQHAAIRRRLPQATDGNGVLTYALSGTLPAGLTFDPATRVLTGTRPSSNRRPLTRIR